MQRQFGLLNSQSRSPSRCLLGQLPFSILVVASHDWIYPGRDNGSPGPPWRRGRRTRSLNGVLVRLSSLSEPRASRGWSCTCSVGLVDPKPSVFLQSFIQERAVHTVPTVKC